MDNSYLFYYAAPLKQSNSCQNISPEAYFSYTTSNFGFYQKFMCITQSHSNLLKELGSVKSELSQVKKNYEELKIKVETSSLGERVTAVTTQKKLKKSFKKNIMCPFESCQNKYSSRIALNSHLRAKHGRNATQRKKNRVTVDSNA